MTTARVPATAAALEIYQASEVVDLHVETFVWTRILRYDLARPHGRGPLQARYLGQADLPRLRAAGLSAVVLSIATNPTRRRGTRPATLLANLRRLQRITADARATPDSESALTSMSS